MAGDLLQILVVKRLDFVNLKQMLVLNCQRNVCLLQTSCRQVICLQWKHQSMDQLIDVVWAIEIGENPVWNFCDKLFVNYVQHLRTNSKWKYA